MPQEDSRKVPFQALDANDAAGADPSAPQVDPHGEPTISSVHAEGAFSQPTRFDPDAPIHRGAAAFSSTRPSRDVNYVALPPGYLLNEYAIESVLGCGGFGITYLARDNNLQCGVAVKEYLPNELAVRTAGQTVCPRTDTDSHGYRAGLKGFLSESRVLASFRHPNIVRVTRFFEANNTAYMVMDYEKGQPLREWLKLNGPVEEAPLLRMFLPLLDGLEVVHKAGVLHRDIKPANIFVREADGSLVLLDFGSARYAGGGTSRSLTSIVTPGYAPFEQYHTHGAQGPWSDLYAMGGVLYWLVTGQKPVEAPSRVRKDEMPPASSLAAGRYGDRMLRAIDWALTPDETNRPKSVGEFRAALTGQAAAPVFRPAPPEPAGPPSAKPAAKRWALGAAGGVLAAIAAFVFLPGLNGVVSGPAQTAAQRAAPATLPERAPAEVKESAAARPEAAPAAHLVFQVIPRGEVFLDGRKVGTSPPLGRLKIAPGTHKIEIQGPGMRPPFYWTVNLGNGEARTLRADFSN